MISSAAYDAIIISLRSDSTLPDILRQTVAIIGRCWSQYGPAAVRLRYEDTVYETGIPGGLLFIFTKPLIVGGREAGSVEAGFGEKNNDPGYYEG